MTTGRLYWAIGKIIMLKRSMKPIYGKNPKNWPEAQQRALLVFKRIAKNEKENGAAKTKAA